MGEIVHYLPNKKKQNFVWLFICRYCADRAQNLLGPVPDNCIEICIEIFKVA